MPIASTASTPFGVHHVQLARAVFAAIAAVMITFTPDHSAAVGLSVFSGFAIATGMVWALATWLTYPAGRRWPAILLAAAGLLAGMTAGVVTLRSTTLFFAIVVAWALASGAIEATAGWRALRSWRRPDAAPEPGAARSDDAPAPDAAVLAPATDSSRSAARDALTVGMLTVVLGLALFVVPPQYSLDYFIPDADRSFTLTGITIAVGVFGGYAAIVAVYLGIAGFSPRGQKTAPAAAPTQAPTEASRPGETA